MIYRPITNWDRDIEANPSWEEGAEGCTAYDGSTVPETNACRGWAPVGRVGNPFQGRLEGGGHSVSNLYIKSSSNRVGFFAYTGIQAEIANLGLTDALITATSSFVGGLVGEHDGTIYNSYVTGSISTNATQVGGLVGDNHRGTINKSYATATVTTSSSADDIFSSVGGLVGYNHWGIITNSYATGAVTASHAGEQSGIRIGGLVGYNNVGPITNSYATGAVSTSYSSHVAGGTWAGGLVGRNVSGFVDNSYATGEVSLSIDVSGNVADILYSGGLIGYQQFSPILVLATVTHFKGSSKKVFVDFYPKVC